MMYYLLGWDLSCRVPWALWSAERVQWWEMGTCRGRELWWFLQWWELQRRRLLDAAVWAHRGTEAARWCPGCQLPLNLKVFCKPLAAACSHSWPINLKSFATHFCILMDIARDKPAILFAQVPPLWPSTIWTRQRLSSACCGRDCWVPSASPFPSPFYKSFHILWLQSNKNKLMRPNWSGCFPSCSGPPSGFK